MRIVDRLRKKINETLKEYNIDCELKLSRHSTKADFVVLCHDQGLDITSDVVAILNDGSVKDSCCIHHCLLDSNKNVLIVLNKARIFKQVLLELPSDLSDLTVTPAPKHSMCVIAWFYGCSITEATVTASAIRTALIGHHAAKLLQTTGHRCSLVFAIANCGDRLLTNLKYWVGVFGCHPDIWVSLSKQDEGRKKKVEELLGSVGLTTQPKLTGDQRHDAKDRTSGDQLGKQELVLNLRQYIDSKGLQTGKGGYDRGLDRAVLFMDGAVDPVLLEVALLEQLSETSCADCFLHVDLQSKSFYRQKLTLVWKMLSHHPASENQQLLLHCSVVDMTDKQLVMEDYYRKKNQQMLDIATFKMTCSQQGKGVIAGDHSQALAVIAIKFELLSVGLRNRVRVRMADVERDGGVQDNQSGIFVMYNCARLKALIAKYDSAVRQGVYPELPDPKAIDFSTMTDQGEWSLLWEFLARYSTVVQESSIFSTRPALWAEIETNKVCDFLARLARELSSFYSRVQILQEPKEHLFPCMFARLHLIAGIKQVLEHGLGLLGTSHLEEVI